MAIATTEPKTLTAGNSAAWDKSISDYPATTFLLSYALVPTAGGEAHEFSATASGSLHQVRLSPADTADFDAGDYRLIATVTDIATGGTATKVTLETLRLTVSPAPDSTVDRRTFAESILSDLQATYKKLAANSIQSATVNGRTYTRNTLAEMRDEIIYWQNQVRSETGGAVRRVAVQFNRP